MVEHTWLDYVSAIGSVATPIFVLGLAAIGWRLRSRLERRFALEDKMREDRVGTYNQILEPFILLLTSDAAWKSDPRNKTDKNQLAMQKMLSVEYRSQAFRLSLIGSDSVVKAYNNLMQYFYQRGDQGAPAAEKDVREMLLLLGQFLLEIRRSVGNESTKLDSCDMLEWWMSDARKLRGGRDRIT